MKKVGGGNEKSGVKATNFHRVILMGIWLGKSLVSLEKQVPRG